MNTSLATQPLEATVEIPSKDITLLLNGQNKGERSAYNPDREVFVFTYKKGHSIITNHFQADSLHEAVKDAKEVCRVKRMTFVGVTPFLRDIKRMMLNEEE